MDHAQDWLLFEDNIGESLSIDETCLSSGEVYTFLTNKAGKGRKGTLVAVVKGTKAEDVIQVLKKINLSKRKTVKEITLDLSSSMMRIARAVFPKALITNDRFHVQKLYYDALDDMRIAYRWMARDKENEEIKEAKSKGKEYIPFRYSNGDTRKQLLARAKFILTKHKTKWTETQKGRAQIIFEHYPTLKKAYNLAMKRLSRKKVGKFLYLLSFSFLCIMEDTYLYHLASLVLPKDVLKYFSVVKIEPSPSLLRIHLDEKMEKERLSRKKVWIMHIGF